MSDMCQSHDHWACQSGLGGSRLLKAPLRGDIGDATVSLVTSQMGFLVIRLEGMLRDGLHYTMRGNGWTRFHFRTSAATSLSFDRFGKHHQDGPLCQIFHHPTNMEDEETVAAGSELDWITVFIPPERLGRDYGFDDSAVSEPIRELARGCDDLLIRNWSLRPSMQAIFDQIHSFPTSLQIERTFTEAKAVELICRMAKLVSEADLADLPHMVSDKDIPHIQLAHEILANSYCNPPTVAALARSVGINRNKLSYGFKYLYKTTISEFCNELRLQAALRLLEEGRQSVNEIAFNLGYSQVAAFSAAFRRRFNASPRQIRPTLADRAVTL